jgi:hypothetical protein
MKKFYFIQWESLIQSIKDVFELLVQLNSFYKNENYK